MFLKEENIFCKAFSMSASQAWFGIDSNASLTVETFSHLSVLFAAGETNGND